MWAAYKEEKKKRVERKSNLTAGKLGKHHLGQVTEVNIDSDKSY